MPINTQSLLLSLNPLSAVGMDAGGLKLMREQFEHQKRRDAESDKLALLEEQGRTARQELQGQQAAAERQAAVDAKTKADKQLAFGKFSELNAAGDIEGARAMVPLMTSMGMGVDLEGEEGGLPRYRISMDAAAEAQAEGQRMAQSSAFGPDETAEQSASRLPGMGMEEGSGPLEQAAGISSTGDAFQQALEASRFARVTGAPARAAPAADYTGSVPKNVLDMGAIQAQTLARLNPMLEGAINAYPDAPGADPEAYRRSAEQTAAGLRGMGMPAIKAAEMFKSQRSGPDSLIQSGIEAGAQQGRFDESQALRQDRANDAFYNRGFTTIGGKAGQLYNVEDYLTGREQSKTAREILTNDIDGDDSAVLSMLARRMGERGAMTEGDVGRIAGMSGTFSIDQKSSLSVKDQINNWIETKWDGGLSVDQRDALLGMLENLERQADEKMLTAAEKLEEQASSGDTNPEVARGIRDYAKLFIPIDIHDKVKAKRSAGAGAGAPATATGAGSADFDKALNEQAEAEGLDPGKIRGIIGKESGGDPGAQNDSGATGLIQFMPKTARALGTTTEKLKNMSAAEQVPLVIKYLKSKGLTDKSTQGDYYVALAAPGYVGKPDSTVIVDDGVTWDKDSKAWQQNPSWRPKDGGPITVGSIKAYGGGKKTESKSRASRARELLKEGGYL